MIERAPAWPPADLGPIAALAARYDTHSAPASPA